MAIKYKFSMLTKLKQKRNLSIIVALAFVVATVGGAIFSPKALAADPNLVTGFWHDNQKTLQSPLVRDDEPEGILEVITKFNSEYCPIPGICNATTYHWKIQEFQTDHWVTIWNSHEYDADNGGTDRECYISGIRNGFAYNVKFYSDSGEVNIGNIHGQYWLIGHDHGDCTSYR